MYIVKGKIRAKERPRFNRTTGAVFTPGQTRQYEEEVRYAYEIQGGQILEGNLRAFIIAYYKIPKSYTKKRVQAILRGQEYPCKKPDVDNIAKIILDSLNEVAYADDKQVIELTVLKRYTDEDERVEFEIVELEA